MALLTRRLVLIEALAALGWACQRPAPRPTATATRIAPEAFSGWQREAREILSDALQTLRTFEGYLAFRANNVRTGNQDGPVELAWDPPTRMQWAEALHVSEGLRGRAQQLFLAIARSEVNPAAWREQRDWAQSAQELVDLGDALNAYRARLERIPADSRAMDTQDALDQVWARWESSASQWGASRVERIACGTA